MTVANSSPLWGGYDPKYIKKHSLYDVLSGNQGLWGGNKHTYDDNGGYQADPNAPSIGNYRTATGLNVDPTDAGYQKWFTGTMLGGRDPQEFFNSTNNSSVFNYDPSSGMVNTYRDPELTKNKFGMEDALFMAALAAVGGAAFSGVGAAGAGGAMSGAGSGALAGGAFDMAGMAGMESMFGIGGAGMGGAAGVGMDPSWGVSTPGGDAWFENLMQNYNPDLGFQGLNEAGSGLTGGMGGASSGWDYNEFLQSIGVDPSSTQFSGGTMSNAAINSQIGGGGSWLENLFKNAKSPLGKILGGNGGADDYLNIGGKIGSAALGVYGSNKQSNTLAELAAKSSAERAPFLNAATGWMNDPASYYAGAPAQASMQAVLKGLSTQGNPLGSGTSMALATEAGLRNWQNAVTGFGNMGLSGQDSRNQLLASSAQADRGVTTALASALGSLTQDDQQLLSTLGKALLNLNGKVPV